MKKMDVRGLACPEPIVMAKREMIDKGKSAVKLLVDSKVTRDNLEKFANAKGLEFSEKQKGDEWEIVLTAGEKGKSDAEFVADMVVQKPPVVLCTRETFGGQSGELGTILIRAFFKTLLDLDVKPSVVLFVNEGVKLPCFDEQVVDYCKRLERLEVEVVSCGTCLDYFGWTDKVQVGRVGNMYDIASAMIEAGNLVEP